MEVAYMKKISDLGEKRIIKIILSSLDLMHNMPVPFGDDVSAVLFNKKKLAVMKTDMLVGKTDIPPSMTLRQAARKAIVMNVSDFAAKGVPPLAFLISLGLPRNITEEDVKQIGLGLNDGIREYDTHIIGGDTNEASDLIISCSLFGFCEKDTLVKRSGAHPGDIIAVTGQFGKTAAGLKILLNGWSAPKRIMDPLLEAILMPKARLREGLALAQSDVLTASIDSSDGLAWSLYELAEASNVGMIINEIPLAAEAVEFAECNLIDSFELGLYGGEEYELVLTIQPELWENACAITEKEGQLTRIGVVTKEQELILRRNGKTKTIERKGWEHFKS